MMRKACLLLMLAATTMGVGCLSTGTPIEKQVRELPPVRLEDAPPPPPIVTADLVNNGNAADMAKALDRDMDYDARSIPTMATNASPSRP
jgi:hypothetical protein